jgi:hypothetical protein
MQASLPYVLSYYFQEHRCRQQCGAVLCDFQQTRRVS